MKEDVLSQQYKAQGCTNPGRQVAWATKFCTVAPDVSGFSVLNVLYVTVLVRGIFKWLSDFCKICARLKKDKLFCIFICIRDRSWKLKE
jgi:hypothetical protein